MPFHPFTIDSSVSNVGGGSAYVLEGWYLFEVSGGVLTKEDYKGEMNIRWACRIIEGPDGLGRTIYKTTTFDDKSFWALGKLMTCCGVSPAPLENLQVPSYEWLAAFTAQKLVPSLSGKKFVAMVNDSDFSQSKQSEINTLEMYPEADWGALQRNNSLLAQRQQAMTVASAPIAMPSFPAFAAGVAAATPPAGANGVAPAAAPVTPPAPVATTEQPAVPPVSGELMGKVTEMFGNIQL